MTLDDLDGLIRNPAWQELCLEVRRRWTTHLEDGLAACVDDPDPDGALSKLRQLVAAKREAESIIAWPVEATRRLKQGAAGLGGFQGRPR